MRLLLASASARRLDLLTAAGFTCDVESIDIDERQRPDELPATYVRRLAIEKASAIAERHPSKVVLAADTAVILDETVFGKPADSADAARMLKALAGRQHEVLTGVAIRHGHRQLDHVERTSVWMADLSREQIDWYVASGEPMGKAGAYAIQGLAARFIPRIAGSYSNVVGLPVAAVAAMLAAVGIDGDG
ncbi:MAG: Maf family protein [Vicinamibacterales bacterium]